MKKQIIDELTGKKVLILGFGREGKSTYNFIQHNNIECIVGIADRNDINRQEIAGDVAIHTGNDYMENIFDYDIVIKSPGVSFKGKDYSRCADKITSQTELFLKYGREKVVGITGTKGKSTTSSLIYDMLKKKYNVLLVGNIGRPVFEEIEQYDKADFFVYELSSHQLEHVRYSPCVAVVLNMFEEHLDHYNSYEEYKEAKRNIFKHQKENDIFVFNGDCKDDICKEYPLNQRIFPVISQYTTNQNCVVYSEKTICTYIDNEQECIDIPEKMNIIGKHNIYNIAVATTVCKLLGVESERIVEAVKEFKTLPHRLEVIGKYNEVTYIDDSISTIPEATIAAVESISNVDTVLIGGLDRGIDYSKLIEYIDGSNIHNVILMYDSGRKIYDKVKHKDISHKVIYAKELEEAVKEAINITEKGKVCILSPAAASYGIFKNFEERGDKFKELVKLYNM